MIGRVTEGWPFLIQSHDYFCPTYSLKNRRNSKKETVIELLEIRIVLIMNTLSLWHKHWISKDTTTNTTKMTRLRNDVRGAFELLHAEIARNAMLKEISKEQTAQSIGFASSETNNHSPKGYRKVDDHPMPGRSRPYYVPKT